VGCFCVFWSAARAASCSRVWEPTSPHPPPCGEDAPSSSVSGWRGPSETACEARTLPGFLRCFTVRLGVFDHLPRRAPSLEPVRPLLLGDVSGEAAPSTNGNRVDDCLCGGERLRCGPGLVDVVQLSGEVLRVFFNDEDGFIATPKSDRSGDAWRCTARYRWSGTRPYRGRDYGPWWHLHLYVVSRACYRAGETHYAKRSPQGQGEASHESFPIST
jgi:hypothetical protein